MPRHRVPRAYPSVLAIVRGILVALEVAAIGLCLGVIGRWTDLYAAVLGALPSAIWALLWDGIELLGLLDRQRKIRRVPQNWMPVVDLVIVLACCITPWVVYLAFTFFHACDDGGCSDARPLIHAAVYLTVAIGAIHFPMIIVGCSTRCMSPRSKAKVMVAPEPMRLSDRNAPPPPYTPKSMARHRVPQAYPTTLAILRSLIFTVEFPILLACVGLLARWPAIRNDLFSCLGISAWASFWDAFEILGLVITRVKVPRASHSWMVCIDLLTALSCWIIPPLVWVSFHYGEACDPDECVPRRQVEDFDLPGIDMVPIYLAIVIGLLHCCMMCKGCSINCMSPRERARIYIMTEEEIAVQSLPRRSRYARSTPEPAPAPVYTQTEAPDETVAEVAPAPTYTRNEAETEPTQETERVEEAVPAPAYVETENDPEPEPVPAYEAPTSNIKTGPYADPTP